MLERVCVRVRAKREGKESTSTVLVSADPGSRGELMPEEIEA